MTNKYLALIVVALAAGADSVCQAQMPAIRQLGPVTVVGKDSLGAVTTVRQLPGGRVLVNDIVGRRVVMLDSSLSSLTVIADTTSATANAYGVRPGGLIAYRGDSTLFIDPASLSMLLIDPTGKIARVMSAPRANDVGFLVGGPFGNPGFDAQGRLIYRAPPRFQFNGPRPSSATALPQLPTPPDSAALVRFDLATRKLDTVTWFKTPKINLNVNRSPTGEVRVVSSMNPLPQGDDWAILPDGTIALVRGRDFHVDWVGPTGITSAPKIPFDWERLTDEGKVAFIDSARVAIEKARASGQLNAGAFGPMLRGPVERGASGPLTEGAPRDGATREGGGPPGAAGGGAAGAGTMTVTANGNTTVTAIGPGGGGPIPPLTMVSPSDLPDYKPAFTPGSTRADADGNLWIRTSQNVDARPVYDVVNRKGELIDRVQLPQNRVLAGFGANGAVYLAVRDGTTAHLEKARIK
jgi:hypothetical protein